MPLCVAEAPAYVYFHNLEFLGHPLGPFMLHISGKPFAMHWKCPLDVPKRWAITSLTVRPALRRICEWRTWPPPALTLECYSGCEYEIQPPKVGCAKVSPRLLRVPRANLSQASPKAACAHLRVSGLRADGRDFDRLSVSRGRAGRGLLRWGGPAGADWAGQVARLDAGMQGIRRALLCLALTWCYMCCFSWVCCGMKSRQSCAC